MYRYFAFAVKFFLILFLAFSFAKAQTNETNSSYIKAQKQSFAGEDLLVLGALDAQYRGDFKNAAELYKELYAKSGNTEYLKSSIRLFLASSNETTTADELIQKGLQKYPHDFDYERFDIAKLLKANDIKGAEKKSLRLLSQEESEQNLRLTGSIYVYLQDYEKALGYFKRAFAINADEQVMLQIANLYLRLGKTKEAVAEIETFVRINGCSIESCYTLIDIYGKYKNMDALLGIYKRLYAQMENEEYAQKVFEIFMFQNKQKEAIEFLEESGYKPDLLIDMYSMEKQFDKAVDLAKKIYEESGNLEYLSKMAVLEYEATDKKTPALLDSVSSKFEKSINSQSEDLYLNYYGYLLINHDINITKGLELVKQALATQPDSPYYQDSLAWGLYKQKNCKEAYDIMRQVAEKLNDKETAEHLKLIKTCATETDRKAQK